LLGSFATITLPRGIYLRLPDDSYSGCQRAQLTPRLIATTLLCNRVVKYTFGLFIFTLMFALSAQNLMDKEVHQLVMRRIHDFHLDRRDRLSRICAGTDTSCRKLFISWSFAVFPFWVFLISVYILIDNLVENSKADGG
jgi:hypothetical protein